MVPATAVAASPVVILTDRINVRKRLEIEVVGTEMIGRLEPGAFDLGLAHRRFDRTDHTCGDPVLEVEHIFQFKYIKAPTPAKGAAILPIGPVIGILLAPTNPAVR